VIKVDLALFNSNLFGFCKLIGICQPPLNRVFYEGFPTVGLKGQNRGYSIISPAEKSIWDELAAAEF
jgi:hypothetical protein